MKYRTLRTFALVGLLFVLAAASVHAQSWNTITANIPFDFAVGDAKLKAGEYTVDRVDMQRLVVTSVDGKVRIFALAPRTLEQAGNHAAQRLVFHRYGDIYFLSEVWIDGNNTGLYAAKAERQMRKELARTNAKSETTEIVAHAR